MQCVALCTAAAMAMTLPAHAGADKSTDAISSSAFLGEANQPQEVYLEVTLNGERQGPLQRFVLRGGKLFATGQTLAAIGLASDKLGVPAAQEVSLDALQGLRYRYDASTQTVALTVENRLRKPYTLDARQLQATPKASSGRGVIVNYDAIAQSDARSRLALWSEERYFDPRGVFSNTGVAYLDADMHHYVRYDTSWTESDPDTLSSVQWGDTISSSLSWSRSIRLAGWQWRSNFALRPDLVTFPLPMLSGSAAVPTALDLYINNMHQLHTDVPAGPFELTNAPGITGAGQATVVTRDALGRSLSTSLPLYVDPRLLSAGLSSYSLELGFVRRNYGLDSDDYDPHPAGSGTWRYGASDSVTVEGHGEAGDGLFDAGGGALVRLGMAGVVNGAISASGGRMQGTQLNLGYQLIEARFSINAQTTRTFGDYGDLAAREGTPVPSAIDQVTVSFPFFSQQDLAVSYIGYQVRGGVSSRLGSVSYNLSFGNLLSLYFSGYQDFAQHRSRGVFIGVNIGLGDRVSLDTTVGRQNGKLYYNTNAVRTPDYGGGWGWGLQSGGSGGINYRQAQLEYLGSDGQLTGTLDTIAGHTTGSLEALGSVVLMDDSVQLSRRIYDGFALVSTDGVADIPVLHDNRVIGVTDAQGHLLVPDLNSYQDNHLAIDSLRLPADMHIDQTAADVVPQSESGVLAHFPLGHDESASVILHDAKGKPLAPGSRVRYLESGAETVVGYDGLTFIENLHPDNHLQVDTPAGTCMASFRYRRPQHHDVPTIGPLLCQVQQVHSP
ncbi:fimbria/pilus outer membrane usher protein [Dyella acidiphila]|uniref:Fimbrial biogenesis outer membrane usher protein n=1 Tax=Dyella acidiphila TaxID=2775866 RepID=A0ABR9GD97_9GAMM|nr:fimbria/pilus outer membrane usher protein [Dyella acidiphila]MBE1162026.1 fimbrial biogenesis outer membrane usher protein [Dyella acidiphila]